MSIETVRVTPGRLPPTISTTPNSPIVWAKLKATPVTRPDAERGRITRKKVRSFEAPKVAEAAINLGSTAANDAANGCTANGKLYRREPITSPLNVNARVWLVRASHQRPIGLCGPRATRQ